MASVKHAVKKVEKTLGVKMQRAENGRWWVKYNNEILGFYDQAGQAICIQIKPANDKSNPLTDYYDGVFANNISQALRLLG